MTLLRRALRLLIPLVCIPLTVLIGAVAIDARRYALVTLIVSAWVILLFMLGYENRVVGHRRAVLVAVMVALSVVGRMIPLLKPITAITILSAMYLGAESGFAVGALSALISNFYFGQGPWTPFQMLAWGLIGLIAGWSRGVLKRSRVLLLGFGLLSGVLYSALMDVWTVLWYGEGFSWSLYLASTVSALPHTALYAVSNFLFLWFLAKPFGQKLHRIQIKYGI